MGEPAHDWVRAGGAAPAAGLTPGVDLPPYRVRARNLFRHSPNCIHEDEVARAHGFGGGLVAGTTVYGYLSHPLVAALGLAWLERGTGRARFRRPVYEGDLLTVRTRVTARSGGPVAGELALEVEAAPEGREPVATLVAGLAWGSAPVLPALDRYPVAPLPVAPPPAGSDTLAPGTLLGSPALDLDEALATRSADDLDEPLELYRGPRAVAHPGLLLQEANHALSRNVALGPWVHVESDVAHAGLARAGDRLSTRGRVSRLYERRGHRLVELDLLVVADRERPVLHVRHTAIWALAPSP